MDLDLDNLTAIRVLGRGAMGTVFLVSDRSSSPPFALKVVEKSCPRAKPDSDRRAHWELSVLSRLSHPFLPSLLGSLETPSLLAYAFPYCPGGDLNSLRHTLADSVFSSCAIKFYLSEILTAISHLHSLNIVYRDLKPENVLIKSDGHVVLSDFDLSRYLQPKVAGVFVSSDSNSTSPPPSSGSGTAAAHRRSLTRMFFGTDNIIHHLKKTKSARVSPVSRRRSSSSSVVVDAGFHRSHSFVGTEEYVAPEIIRGDGHDFAVDFWALGVLAYEMAYGRTPFKGSSRKETFRNVLVRQPEFEGRQRTELTDLISRLLAKDPAKRLGGNGGGTEEVRRHAFFRGVRWEMLPEVGRPPFFATAEDLEEAAGSPGGYARDTGMPAPAGFDIREYFDKVRSPEPESSVTEYS